MSDAVKIGIQTSVQLRLYILADGTNEGKGVLEGCCEAEIGGDYE